METFDRTKFYDFYSLTLREVFHVKIRGDSGGADQHYMVTKSIKESKLATIKATFISKYHCILHKNE